jgi:hypothetical protein
MLPKIGNYGRYTSGNYGAHTLYIVIGPLTIWFSYKTAIAFQVDGNDRVIHKNIWSTTTGKHLNMIDYDKSKRVSAEVFQKAWDKQVIPALKRLMRVA